MATWCEELTYLKRPRCWERLRAGGEGDNRDEVVGWHHRLDGHGFGWTLGVGDGQGCLACCNSWGRKELDTTERLNWTEPIWVVQPNYSSSQKQRRLFPWSQRCRWREGRRETKKGWWGVGGQQPWRFQVWEVVHMPLLTLSCRGSLVRLIERPLWAKIRK